MATETLFPVRLWDDPPRSYMLILTLHEHHQISRQEIINKVCMLEPAYIGRPATLIIKGMTINDHYFPHDPLLATAHLVFQ